jgi:Tfp pilus assembly protein PilE
MNVYDSIFWVLFAVEKKSMRKGYTTLELLTVVSTIALLASAMVPVYQQMTGDARTIKSTADMQIMQNGGMKYLK